MDMEEQTRSKASARLRREERLEGMVEHFGRHPVTGIGHANDDVLARGKLRNGADILLVDKHIGGFNGELAAIRHGVARVDSQIHQRRFEVIGVDLNPPETRSSDSFKRSLSRCPPSQVANHLEIGQLE